MSNIKKNCNYKSNNYSNLNRYDSVTTYPVSKKVQENFGSFSIQAAVRCSSSNPCSNNKDCVKRADGKGLMLPGVM